MKVQKSCTQCEIIIKKKEITANWYLIFRCMCMTYKWDEQMS